MARKRRKINYCYQDYKSTLSEEERTDYQKRFAPLIDIMVNAADDREIMTLAKAYDSEHQTTMFEEAVHLTVYCIACSKFNCDC